MKVIVQVADKYHFIIPAFCKLFNKYWANQECVFLCFEKLEFSVPDNFRIVYLGEDSGFWTLNFRKFLLDFNEEYFVLHLDDFLITDYVKIDRFKKMEKEIVENGADKAMLHSHLNVYADKLHDDVLIIKQDSDYRNTVHTAIWRTDYFLECSKIDRSVWNFEIDGSVKNNGKKIVSLDCENRYNDNIIDCINLLRGGRVDSSMHGLANEEDIEVFLQIPFSNENRDVLIKRLSNICTVCAEKIDKILIKDTLDMRKYEQQGICYHCQRKGF